MQSNLSSAEIIGNWELKKQEAIANLEEVINKLGSPSNSEEVENMERKVAEATDNIAAQVIGMKIQETLLDEDQKEKVKKIVKSYPRKQKNNGNKNVTITVLRGGTITVTVNFYIRKGTGEIIAPAIAKTRK